MKRIVRLTESDLKNIVKKSVGKVLREYGSDGPDFDDLMNRDGYEGTNVPDGLEYDELDASEDFDDFLSNSMREPGAYDGVGTVHTPNANDFDTNDELLGLDDDEPVDFESDDLLNFESKRRMGRIIRESINRVLNKGMLMEKHRPSGVSRRINKA